MIGADGEATASPAIRKRAARLLEQIGVGREEVRRSARRRRLRARARFSARRCAPPNSPMPGVAKARPILARGRDRRGARRRRAHRGRQRDRGGARARRRDAEALETPGSTAALITPDPAIARRVAAELAAGDRDREFRRPAARRYRKRRFRAARSRRRARFRPRARGAARLIALTRLGRSARRSRGGARAGARRAARVLPPAGLDDRRRLAAARAAAGSPYAHPAARRLSDADFAAPRRCCRSRRRAGAVARRRRRAARRLPRRASHALAALSADGRLARRQRRRGARRAVRRWARRGDGLSLRPRRLRRDVRPPLAAERAPPGPRGHPRLAILGLLEARLLSLRPALLAGLDETVWPPAARTDAFLNRQMRADLGLSPPERRIGQTAQDFVAALGAPRRVVTASEKRGGSPTVASRFLRRIEALAGEAAMARPRRAARAISSSRARSTGPTPRCRAAAPRRGRRWSCGRSSSASPASRRCAATPMRSTPSASSSLQPLRADRRRDGAARDRRRLARRPASLLRDLRRRALAGGDARAADGAGASRFRRSHSPIPPSARCAGRASARGSTCSSISTPRGASSPSAIWSRQRQAGASAGRRLDLHADRARRPHRAQPRRRRRRDRLQDRRAAGQARSPGRLRAAAHARGGDAERGGFADIAARRDLEAIYLKLGGADGGSASRCSSRTHVRRSRREPLRRLKQLLDSFAKPDDAYLSRPFPKFAKRHGDYDHLARVKEWSATGGLADEQRGDGMSVRLDIPRRHARAARASDPEGSAWVSANAGSGKTHVLAQRVLRLLLAGAAPSGILCLTFTKAAAANMSERVFEGLARWTRSTTRSSPQRSSSSARRGRDAAHLDLRAQAVRARDRDAGRP